QRDLHSFPTRRSSDLALWQRLFGLCHDGGPGRLPDQPGADQDRQYSLRRLCRRPESGQCPGGRDDRDHRRRDGCVRRAPAAIQPVVPMKKARLSPWDIAWLVFAALYFLIPLYGTAEFSLETGVGKYGIDAYQHVIGDTSLQQIDFKDTFPLSLKLAVATVILSIVLMVPTVYWVHLKLPRVRQIMDFVATLPLVIPPITLAVGILQLFQAGSQQSRGPAQVLVADPSSWLLSGPQILALSYVILGLPFTYRSLDAGMRAIT